MNTIKCEGWEQKDQGHVYFGRHSSQVVSFALIIVDGNISCAIHHGGNILEINKGWAAASDCMV